MRPIFLDDGHQVRVLPVVYGLQLIPFLVGMEQRESNAFSAAFTLLEHVIDKFKANLPPLSHFDASAHAVTRTLVFTHALVEGAVIKLHSHFTSTDASSRQKTLAAARAIVGVGGINIRDFGYVNPMMGVRTCSHYI